MAEMSRHDRIIADLMTALDAIRREAHEKASEGSLDFIFGLAGQAMTNCDAQRERNTDGYLVVKRAADPLLTDAVESILALSEWARNVSDAYLDSDPNERRQLVADRAAAKDVVKRLNKANAQAAR
jgi:hypothetical protein